VNTAAASAHIRATIVDALVDAEAAPELDPGLLAAFEAGTGDVELETLELDSIVRMELLVALEMEHGAVVPPSALAELRSLDELVAFVEAAAANGDGDDAVATPTTDGSQERPVPCAPDAPRVVRVFRRAFAGSRTVAQLDRLIVRLEGRLTPLELATLVEHRDALLPAGVGEAFRAELDQRLDALTAALARSGERDPEPFVTTRLGPAVFHAEGPGTRADKTLLVCFSVVGGRKLFVPLPVFLQHLDARRHDLLLVADPEGTAFRGGVPGLGGDVTAVVRAIADLPQLAEYGAVRVLGCSAGAFPAMLLGRRVGAELTVAASGRFPSERHLGALVSMYARCVLAALRAPRARVVLAHSGTKRRDAAYARRLARLTGARRVAVELREHELGHNLFEPLVATGRLSAFLERTLLARAEALDASPRAATLVLDAERVG